MNLTGILGRLLGLENAQSIESVEPSLAAPWATIRPLAVLRLPGAERPGGALLFSLSAGKHAGTRTVLAVCRALALSLLLVALAEPI